METLKKKSRAALKYKNKVFIHSFRFDGKLYVSIDNQGMEFICLDSNNVMTIYDVQEHIKSIALKTVCNMSDLKKKIYIGKISEHSDEYDKKVISISIKFENNLIELGTSCNLIDKK